MNRVQKYEKNRQFILLAILFGIVLYGCNSTSSGNGEKAIELDSALMMPEFTLSTIDDSTIFNSQNINKDGLILIKYFSPDCDHCQEEATLYLTKKDSLTNINTIWVSGDWASLELIHEFYESYQLEQIDPIAVGKDNSMYLLSYFEITGVPFAAIYNNNQLIKKYEGALDFKELININNGNFTTDMPPEATTNSD